MSSQQLRLIEERRRKVKEFYHVHYDWRFKLNKMEMLSFDIYRVQNLDGSETAHFVAQPKLNKEKYKSRNSSQHAFRTNLVSRLPIQCFSGALL
jgi:hypothetical protein